MVQHIGCWLENEDGEPVKFSGLNFAPINLALRAIDEKKERYPWLHTIDEYGDTLLNSLQAPIVIAELERLKEETSQENRDQIQAFIEFIKPIGILQLIRFTGD